MRKLTSMIAHHIADHCKQIFTEYGWPDTLISDNGPCYASKTFKELMKEYHVNHITSSPHYPQSNGLAKKYLQIVKNLFHKAKEEGQRSIQMSDDIQKYTPVKYITVTDANSLQQSHQIYFTTVKCSKMTNGPTQQTSQSESKESTSSNT